MLAFMNALERQPIHLKFLRNQLVKLQQDINILQKGRPLTLAIEIRKNLESPGTTSS